MAGNWHRIGDIKGADGVGVPTGGARGDVLKKEGGTDYATSWGAVNYADIEGKVPASALPEITTAPYVVDSQAAMLNLPAVPGRQAIRTDIGATFVLAEEPASELSNWVEMVSRSDVTSVNNKTGSVVLTKADVGLSEVNNTADSDKPVATQSVRGLMSPSDKKKLDGATSNNRASTVVLRDADRTSAFGQVLINDQPSQSSHTVPLGYLNNQLEGKLDAAITLNAEDLDTITAEGVYRKVGSAQTRDPALNYPDGTNGAGVLVVTQYSTTGIIQEWTSWGAGITSDVRKWIRNSNNSGDAWTDWREMAGAELATSSRDGLMSRADKAKLDGASNGATANSLVIRNSAGRFNAAEPTSEGQVANKRYVDDEVNRLTAGRTALSGSTMRTNWNNLGTTSQAAVVEGFPIGAPAGVAKASDADGSGPWDHFIKDPVWEMRHEALGLSYRKQTVRLLACDPAYMVGFAWERHYNPATSKWTDWACIAGDTGWIGSMSSTANWRSSRGAPFVYKPGNLYGGSEENEPRLRRIGSMVNIQGVFTATEAQREGLGGGSYVNMPTFGWIPTYDRGMAGGRIWAPSSEYDNGRPIGVMTGSSSHTWSAYFIIPSGTQNTDLGGYRYGPGEVRSDVYLPVRASWAARDVYTWEGFTPLPGTA